MSVSLCAVLVRPTFSGNVGSALRAVANMGAERLILIDPQCQLDGMLRQTASGARAWLDRIEVMKSWDEFLTRHGRGARIALTRRVGKRRKVLELGETLREYVAQRPPEYTKEPVYLIFGPEADGLSAEDMAWVHRAAHLPVPGPFKSLNLAQAVLLALFIARQTLPAPQATQIAGEPTTKSHYFPDETIRRWLETIGFSLEKRRRSAYLTIRRLLLQNWPTPEELHVLEAILQQTIRKLEMKSGIQAAPGSAPLFEKATDELG